MLSFKALLRTPFKTLLTFILLAVVSFAFFLRVAEYTITHREIENAAKSYRGVGAVEIKPAPITFSNSDFYIYTDPRIMEGKNEGQQIYIPHHRYTPLSWELIESILELPYVSF